MREVKDACIEHCKFTRLFKVIIISEYSLSSSSATTRLLHRSTRTPTRPVPSINPSAVYLQTVEGGFAELRRLVCSNIC